MLRFDEKGSNVVPLVHIVLIDVSFLFLGVVAKKMRNSQELMRRKAKGMLSKERKKPNEV